MCDFSPVRFRMSQWTYCNDLLDLKWKSTQNLDTTLSFVSLLLLLLLLMQFLVALVIFLSSPYGELCYELEMVVIRMKIISIMTIYTIVIILQHYYE